MFKSRSHGITIVHADALSFVSYASNEMQVDHTVPLEEFLADDFEPTSIPANVRNRQNRLLLVPDYWLGQNNLTLQSKKPSIVEPFIERNLASEFPDLPDIGLFYEYAFTTDSQEAGNLYVFYLQEPTSYRLYKQFEVLGMPPFDITTPAFIWAKKLRQIHSEMVDAGVGLIHILPDSSHLYFYHQEQFLFSRSIQSMQTQGDENDVLNALTYEVNQSVYLFSQKKKADLQYIFIDSPNEQDAKELSDSLGREVQALDSSGAREEFLRETTGILGPCSIFYPKDLAASRKFLAITQKEHAKAREWRPVQVAGVLIGILLFLILGAEQYYLIRWLEKYPQQNKISSVTGQSAREVIERYNESLDLVMNETKQRSSWKTMVDLAKCLPENVRIKQLKLDIAEVSAVSLICVVRTKDMAGFRDSLSLLLANISETFTGSPRLETRDVELGEVQSGQGYTDFPIEFELKLL